ncbi:MAG: membrane protein insertion efficiency factor YidD [Ruminococcaceae bacterium]|nr:membrane protein insertion efficiency factor YidD [Oscillospiraceae bacterium]
MNRISRFLGEVILLPVRFYRKFISPLKKPCCKYTPTCSEYTLIAVRKYGPLKGGFKSLWRILRCNPFSKGGIDEP